MKVIVVFVCLLLLSLGNVQAASPDASGYAGMRWGSSLDSLQGSKKLVLTKANDGLGGSLYALQNEKMHYGKGSLSGIQCSFQKERLQGVILLFAGAKNYDAVKAEATARYGQPIKVSQADGDMYTWPGKNTSIVLSYAPKGKSGFLFLKAKKMPAGAVTAKNTTKKESPKKAETNKKTVTKTPAAAIKPTPQQDTAAQQQPQAAPQVPTAQGEQQDVNIMDQASQGYGNDNQAPAGDTAQNNGNYGPSAGAAAVDGNAGNTAQAPQQANAGQAVNPEDQGLIDRDQALTRLCWNTVGPAADQSCAEMQENSRMLQQRGWCMKPGNNEDGLEVRWFRCNQGNNTSAPVVSASPDAAPAPDYTPNNANNPYTNNAPNAGGNVQTTPNAQTTAPAQQQQPAPAANTNICSLVSSLFSTAVTQRDQGASPQDAENALVQSQLGQPRQLDIQYIRETVELVYFDDRYRTLPPQQLLQQVGYQCSSGQGPYIKPLPAQ